jgi:hypothetical protein
MTIVFAKTRWHYDSYIDFWRLVELSGYETCYVDEMDIHDKSKTYIVSPMNGEFAPFIQNRLLKGARQSGLFLWNLERPSGSSGLGRYRSDNQEMVDKGWLDAILVSDMQLARDAGFKYLPLGSHESLGVPGIFADKLYAIIHLSCYSNNRSWLFDRPDKPKDRIGDVIIAPNGWGDERHRHLQLSRFMLSVHQDGMPYIEPLRFSLAAAYALPIIGEASLDTFPYRTGSDIYMYPYQAARSMLTFTTFVRSLADYQDTLWNSNGHGLRDRMTVEFSFRSCIRKYL